MDDLVKDDELGLQLEPMPDAMLRMVQEAEAYLPRLHSLSQSATDPHLSSAAETYLCRHGQITSDPDRWTHDYIEDTLDCIVAMNRLAEDGQERLILRGNSLSMERQIRIQTMSAWMRRDLTNLQEGRQVHEPFMCSVAPRHIAQRAAFKETSKDAAEFWVLSRFAPIYHGLTGRTLSFVRKGLTLDQGGEREPDFVLQDVGTSEMVGIEMTEAISPIHAAQDRYFWGIVDDLRSRLIPFSGSVTIFDRQYGCHSDLRWDLIDRHYRAAFLDSVLKEVKGGRCGATTVTLGTEPWSEGIRIDVRPSEGELMVLHSDQYGWSGDNPERLAAQDLLGAVSNKVMGKEPYTTTETILVAYPVEKAPTMGFHKVLPYLQPDLRQVLSGNDRFQEIWVCKQKAWRLFPEFGS